MTLYGDQATISATTAGVTGTIKVPDGARLVGLNISMKTADGGIISAIELIIPNLATPQRFNFTHGFGSIATNMYGIALGDTPTIPLNIPIKGAQSVDVKVTTTANETVYVGLMWIA